MKNMGNYVRTMTDERMLIEFPIPGVNAEAIEVMVRPNKFEDPDNPDRAFGKDVVVKVDNEKLVKGDKFGYLNTITGLKETVKIPADYNIAKVAWTYKDGLLKISVPKIDEFKGVKIAATAPAEPVAE
jgi:HSP20 family molecular chaperone IbpA